MRILVPILIFAVLALVLSGVALTILLIIITRKDDAETLESNVVDLDGPGLGNSIQDFAFTRIRSESYMFWWYFKAKVPSPPERPLLIWLDGVIGATPSLQANFLSFGPYDVEMNERNGSWVDDFNLLFIDAPVGQGFSYAEQASGFSTTPEENANDILETLISFFGRHPELKDAEVYLFGQGYGGRMVVDLAILLNEVIQNNQLECNFKGIALGNPLLSIDAIVSQIGDYLEELGYVDNVGRVAVDELTTQITGLVAQGNYQAALQGLLILEQEIQSETNAASINMNNIIDRLYIGSPTLSVQIFTRSSYANFMDNVVRPLLGISSASFDGQKSAAIPIFLLDLMRPVTNNLERILNETDYDVWIYNGNMDSLSNPLGIKRWFESMSWNNKQLFLASPRLPFAVDGLLEGHTRTFEKLRYVWLNTAGVNVPIDSSAGFREILRRMTGY